LSSKKQQTAVLYFTRSAREEAQAKNFCRSGNFAQNRAVAQKLIDHTYKQVQLSDLPIRVFDSETQEGKSFGEKLGNAFQSLFHEGYDNVIAVGNDCVQLSSDTIKHAAQLLNEDSLVAGPAADGGTYLLGISRQSFQKDAFSSLAWQTELLLDDFIRYAQDSGFALRKLRTFADVDNEESLRLFLQQALRPALYFRFVMTLLSILSSSVYICLRYEAAFISHHLRLPIARRGPPVS
jgi:glycosyltransferase A (GT-A) superfamily protein (DUF2064 family)